LEQSNCALVGQIKRIDSIKNVQYNCENYKNRTWMKKTMKMYNSNYS